MILFLRRIPANTRLNEIADYLAPALKGGLFKRAGRIINIEILTLHDLKLKSYEYHGLVTVDSEVSGHRAIKYLKGRPFKGKHIQVREFVQRRWQNDPRLNPEKLENPAQERRKADRRRNNKQIEKMEDISDKISSSGDFVRKL